MMDGDQKRGKNTSPGEVSFSSYLTTAEEIFVHKFAEPQVSIRRLQTNNKSQVGDQICVFGAEKYFNTKLEDDDDKFSTKQDAELGPRRWPGTPSASSEASWNSQSVLLRSSMRDRSLNKPKRSSFFSNLSCTGSCSDGKSVHINQKVDHGRAVKPKFHVKDHEFDHMSVGSNREVSFKTQLNDDPRKSLEVFGSTAMKKGDITKNLEKKLSMLTWDAIPNTPTVSSVSRSTRVDDDDDDVQSDCSSDLFEINNIYGDGPYAPNETSRVANAAKEAQRSRSGGIMGCKSHKAVLVVENKYTRDRKMKSPPSIIDR